jgi:hypothetical protein
MPLRARIAGTEVALGSRLGLLPVLSYLMGLVWSGTPSGLVIQWSQASRSWHGPMPDTASEWSSYFVDPSAESPRRLHDVRSEPVEMFVMASHTQTEDAKLFGYGNDLLGSAKQLQRRSQRIADFPADRWRGGRSTFPVERYLVADSAELTGFRAEAFLCLSLSLDLHRVDAGRVLAATTAVEAREDQLVPFPGESTLVARMSTASLHEISLIHRHVVHLREAAPLRAILAGALGS